jgi:hypothetical protein
MEASSKSLYDVIILESNGRERSIDLNLGAVQFRYYEDIFSPFISAKLLVTTTGEAIEKDGVKQGIYNGLPLRGGERLALRISPNTNSNVPLDFASNFDDFFYVTSISNVIIEEGKETFILHLCSRESITNETSRITGKYPSSLKINESVEKILTEKLQTRKIGTIDKTSNKYGFIGNMRKPFTVLLWLASKGVPVESKEATAGFLFYQTKEGFQFRSIDELNKQEPKASYVYSETSDAYSSDQKKLNNDFKILKYNVDRNTNLLEKLRLGAFATQRIFFNPIDFSFTSPEKGLFKSSDYIEKTETLGDRMKLPKINPDEERTLGDVPSRMLTQVLDFGTIEKDVSLDSNSDPQQYQSQSLMRYNSLLNQQLSMTIGLNSNLNAGDLIECNFPRVSNSDEPQYDEDISGLYMIEELCHYYDTNNSYTSLTLVRDSFGKRRKK